MRIPPCKPGDRIRLLEMPDDPCLIPAGSTGTVQHLTEMKFADRDDIQIAVKWDSNRTLYLVWPIDKFEVITDAA